MSFSPSLVFITAMCAAESSGNQYKITHDRHGNAHYGILQIGEKVVEDVNEFQRIRSQRDGVKRRKYRHRDMLKEEESIEVFKIYMERYCTRKLLGHEPTEFDAAMIWRLGPVGRKKASNASAGHAYWMLVEMQMDRIKAESPAPVISLQLAVAQ